jgi:predicted metal-binding membrane protein
MAAGMIGAGHAPPLGMGGAGLGPGEGGAVSSLAARVIDVLCRPGLSAAASGGPLALSLDLSLALALSFAMWCAMTLAMMLPSASGVILTYTDIAATAAAKREPVVTPLVLAGGYLSVWLGFAVAASLLQIVLVSSAPAAAASGTLAPAILLAAGFYQFSSLKHACLRKCQHPFTFLLLNWSTEPRGVFALGLRQGSYCLGCCWALMLVMFAVGTMNIVWMAALGAVMSIEKMSNGKTFSHVVGVAMLALGAGLLIMGLVDR